jgi:tetratricopeptide (TPR) repeat protein
VAELLTAAILPVCFASAAQAQDREDLIDRFREECRDLHPELRGQRGALRPCIRGKMRAYLTGQAEASEVRINALIDPGKLKAAEALARQTIARMTGLSAPAGKRIQVRRALLGLARVQTQLGQYREGEQAARRALEIFEGTGMARGKAAASGMLALLLTLQGRQAEAEALFTRVLPMLERDPLAYHPLAANTLSNFARLRAEQGRQALP